jgi:DedD protein
VLSFLKRKDSPAPAHAVDEAASVQAARTRARRRLIGAAVLVGVGIIGFPLLFETQPRPIAVDIPIVIPSRDNAPPLALPPAKSLPPPVAQAPAPAPVVAEPAPTVAPASPPPVAIAPPPPPSPPTPAPAPAPAPVPAPAPRPAPDNSDAQRAQALLEGKPVAAAPAPVASEAKAARFVVQAGAYTDAATLREARQKVEKLGLKTYTQVVETEGGARTRVRVGPFDTREEAEKAAARIKSSGLAANILSL